MVATLRRNASPPPHPCRPSTQRSSAPLIVAVSRTRLPCSGATSELLCYSHPYSKFSLDPIGKARKRAGKVTATLTATWAPVDGQRQPLAAVQTRNPIVDGHERTTVNGNTRT